MPHTEYQSKVNRNVFLILIVIGLSLSVCSCVNDTSYTVQKDGNTYIIDRENNTITDGTYIYEYTFYGKSSGYSIDITYPDGSTWGAHYREAEVPEGGVRITIKTDI